MIDDSEEGKIAGKNAFLHTLVVAILSGIAAAFLNTHLAIGILIYLSTNLLLYYILRVGLDIKKVQQQNKELKFRNP